MPHSTATESNSRRWPHQVDPPRRRSCSSRFRRGAPTASSRSPWIGWLSNRRSKGATHRPSPPPSIPTISGSRPLRLTLLRLGARTAPKRSAVTGLGLPDDPIAEIISRLPAKPLFRFKYVSKAWFRLITDWLRKLKFPQTLQGFFYGDNDGNNYGHFFNLLGGSVPPVDPAFSFLPQLPETQKFILLRSCNGLVLFRHKQYLNAGHAKTLGYIVCNPATKEWVTVPRSGWTLAKGQGDYDPEEWPAVTYLIFDPAVSSQFKLVQFCHDSGLNMSQVYTYSSKSGVWSERASECWSSETVGSCVGSAFVNGMLHLIVHRSYEQLSMIVAVDGEGEKCRIIHWAEQERGLLVFLGQSQGNLICMSGHIVDHQTGFITELSIWVLEDYGTEQWMLKDRLSYLQLFGEVSLSRCFLSFPIAIHPDRNVFFFVYGLNGKLVSYDMDSKEEAWTGLFQFPK
ncbi:F-box protein At5g49610 [Setaria viridis]